MALMFTLKSAFAVTPFTMFVHLCTYVGKCCSTHDRDQARLLAKRVGTVSFVSRLMK